MDIVLSLLECASHPDKENSSNYFYRIGFDENKFRLGWVIPPLWKDIKNSLKEIRPFLKKKKKFIFVGMGGSINGARVISYLDKKRRLFFLNNLDPKNLEEVMENIRLKETLVIAISKSGTTQETQLLAKTMKTFFGKNWKNQFLWLSDSSSFKKLDGLGWKGANKFPIQVDGKEDIGGRFSSPHTLVFLLPLFIILDQDFDKMEKIFTCYLHLLDRLRKEAAELALFFKKERQGFFNIRVRRNFKVPFTTWITQLFQESLGSKKRDFFVKTMIGEKDSFLNITLPLKVADPVIYIMSLMYFLQTFVALFSFYKKINFVNQPYVEKYKNKVKGLEEEKLKLPSLKLSYLSSLIRNKLDRHKKFIEVIIYAYLKKKEVDYIKKILRRDFPYVKSFVFEGPDWNHHSYQAAFLDKNTLYVIGLKKSYSSKLDNSLIENNISFLKRIGFATYLTLSPKSLIFSF